MKLNMSMLIALLVSVALAFLVAYLPGPGGKEQLTLGIGYTLLVLIFMFGVAVLVNIVTGAINLSQLLEEVDGGASMSRFQLLIFTFAIAFSLFMIVAANPTGFPAIPSAVIMLLGISSSTYAVSKGIHMGNQAPEGEDTAQPKANGGPSGG